MDDLELISRARQGDEVSWEAFLHAHQDSAFRLAYLFLGDPNQAEDVVVGADGYLRSWAGPGWTILLAT